MLAALEKLNTIKVLCRVGNTGAVGRSIALRHFHPCEVALSSFC